MLLISFFLLTSLTLSCDTALTFETCGRDGVLEIPESQLYGNTGNLYTDFSCRSTLLPGSENFINLIFHDEDANTSTPIAWCGATLRGFYSSACSSSSMTPPNTNVIFTLLTPNTNACWYRFEFLKNNEPAAVGNTLMCRHDTEQVQCTIDVVSPAQETQCNLTLVTDVLPWTLSAQCDINDTYSGMGRYFCQLFARNTNVANSSDEAVGSRVSMQNTSRSGQKLVSGSCFMNATLPSSDGSYSYSVQITPGNSTVSINHTSIEIQRPSLSKLTHSCPSSISERDPLSCTCSYEGTSIPPSTVQWSGESSGHLQRGSVKRDQNGHNFTCQLMWNEEVFDQLTYTLNVSWSPDSNNANNTCPACVTEATSTDGSLGLTSTHILAIGIGGGLSVTAICVTIIVVVVVCRKRRDIPQNRLRSDERDEIGPCPRLQALSRPSNAPPGIEDLARVEQARVGYDALRKEENLDGQNYELMGMPSGTNPKLSPSDNRTYGNI